MLALVTLAMGAPISFEAPAMPLEALLPALGRVMGRDLRANVTCAHDVGYLNLRQADPQRVLDEIARTFRAQWDADGQTLRLVRTPSQNARDMEDEKLARKASLVEALSKLKSDLQEIGEFDDAAAQQAARQIAAFLVAQDGRNPEGREIQQAMGLAKSSPTMRIATEIVLSMGASQLAEVPPDKTWTFATSPHPSQRALGRDVERLVKRLNIDRARFRPAARSAGLQRFVNYGEWPYGLDSIWKSAHVEEEVSRVVVRVFGGASRPQVGANVTFADQRGRQIASHYIRIAGPEVSASEWMRVSPEWSSLTQAADTDARRKSPAPETYLARLRRPDIYDPMSIAPSDYLRALAKRAEANVVAYLGDDVALTSTYVSLKDEGQELGNRIAGFCTLEKREGYFLIRPRSPHFNRQNRMNRKALTDYLASDQLIEHRAALAASSSSIAATNALMWISFVNFPRDRSLWFEPFIRVYGLMSETERRAAKQGALQFRALNSAAKSGFIEELEAGMFGFSGPDFEYDSSTLDVIASERLPRGVPPETSIRFEERVGFVLTQPGAEYLHFWEPSQLANLARPGNTSLEKYQVHRRREVLVWITLPDGEREAIRLADPGEPTGSPVAYSEFPDELRREIESEYELLLRRESRRTKEPVLVPPLR